MPDITFTIPAAKLQRVLDAINALHPMPEELGMTPQQWTKEYYRRLIVREVKAYESRQAGNAIQADDSMVS